MKLVFTLSEGASARDATKAEKVTEGPLDSAGWLISPGSAAPLIQALWIPTRSLPAPLFFCTLTAACAPNRSRAKP